MSIGQALDDIENKRTGVVGLSATTPVGVFGYTQMVRGESFRNTRRVPTHILMALGKSVSIDKIVQCIGRATGDFKSQLKKNGFGDGPTVLCRHNDYDAIQRYNNFQSELMRQVQEGAELHNVKVTKEDCNMTETSSRGVGTKKFDAKDEVGELTMFSPSKVLRGQEWREQQMDRGAAGSSGIENILLVHIRKLLVEGPDTYWTIDEVAERLKSNPPPMIALASHAQSQRKAGTVAGYQKDDGQGGSFIASDDDEDDGSGGGAGAEPHPANIPIRKGVVSKCLNMLADDGDCKKCGSAGNWQYVARKKRTADEMADSSTDASAGSIAISSGSGSASSSADAGSSRAGTGGEEKRQRTIAIASPGSEDDNPTWTPSGC